MALQLISRRSIVVPRGFGWWIIFIVWVLTSFGTIFADAPAAVPGGAWTRIPVFMFRLAWYASITIVLLWVGNLDEKSLPTQRVVRLIGLLFIYTALGGILGLIAPHLELKSLMQLILPKGLSSVDFVKSMIQPKTADIQSVLGPDLARPTAPFSYANTWGSVIGITLPYFLIAWLGPTARWRRRVAPFLLVLAAVPVVYSLNRGLWICLALGGITLAVQLAFSGKVWALVALGATFLLIAGLIAASPLGDLLVERIHHGHSNGRRSQLLVETVKNATDGSPVIGFGGTRKVQGSFDSIAGGSTPDCHACGVPPLGTQGHIWLVIFSQGLVGAGIYLMFYITQFAKYWRSRTTLQAAGTIVLIFFFVQLFVYDLLGLPLYLISISMALMWRERWRSEAREALA